MKQSSILFACLLIAGTVAAQSPYRNTIKVGALIGETAYEGLVGLGAGVQFDHQLEKHWALSLNGGIVKGKTSPEGSASRVDGNGQVVTNYYSYDVEEQLRHVDLSLLYTFVSKSGKNRFRIGAGPSFAQASLLYPVDIYIDNGVIVRNVAGTHTASAMMGNFVLENDVQIAPRLVAGFRGSFRTAFTEKSILERKVNYSDGYSSTTSGILKTLALSVHVGYQF